MNKKELMKKVKADEGLTVEKIIEYQKIVKPVKHVYGKYGNLALEYLKEHNVGKYWSLAGSLPEYLHNVDKQADRLSPSAEGGTKGFSGKCVGGCAFRVSYKQERRNFLFKEKKTITMCLFFINYNIYTYNIKNLSESIW